MQKTILVGVLSFMLTLPFTRAQESTTDSQSTPQALAHFIAGNVSDCEALISGSIAPEAWNSVPGLLIRARNLVYLGAYAKEQDKIATAQSIGATVIQLLDTVVANLSETDTANRVLQLKLRASVEETLLGNSEQAEQFRQEAAALEPPPTEQPLSPPEE